MVHDFQFQCSAQKTNIFTFSLFKRFRGHLPSSRTPDQSDCWSHSGSAAAGDHHFPGALATKTHNKAAARLVHQLHPFFLESQEIEAKMSAQFRFFFNSQYFCL